MADYQGYFLIRSGTDAERQAATIAARELHSPSDRHELWKGSYLIAGHGYDALAPNPADGGYTDTETFDFPAWWRAHFANVAPVEHSAPYTHKCVLPNTTPAPRNGDKAEVWLTLPAVTTHAITINIYNASAAGTLLFTFTQPAAAAARKWLISFHYISGAWVLTSIAELLTE